MTKSTEKIFDNKNKLYELDYMRFIACFAVIIVHISAIGVTEYIKGSFPNFLMLTLNRSLKFTTPVFIFLSGVTSFYSYSYYNKEFKYLEFLNKRLSKILVAYLVWSVIYYLAYIRMGYHDKINIQFFIESVIQGTMSYHLYFVIIIVQMYVVGPIFYFLLKTKKKIMILAISAVITYLCAEFIRFDLSDRLFLKYMVFYMLGIYVSMEYHKYLRWINNNKKYIISAYVIMSIIYIIVTYYDMAVYTFVWFVFSFVSVFFVYGIGLLLKSMFSNIYGFIKLFGQSSYYIYLMHPLILTIAINYAEVNFLSVTNKILLSTFTVIPITVITCLLFTYLRNSLKKLKKAALNTN
jgi:peptidoglycan/LPS O-acetylase OafA/YrhL